MVGPPQVVDEVMKSPVYSIDINATIQQSKSKMKELDTDFLVVTRNNSPAYVLKKVETLILNPTDTIAKIARQGKIDKAVVVESGSLWASAIPRLAETTLLIVADRTTSPPRLLGVISAYEPKRMDQRRQQYRKW